MVASTKIHHVLLLAAYFTSVFPTINSLSLPSSLPKAPIIPSSSLKGPPISPLLPNKNTAVIIRYFYDGGLIGQGRLCLFQPTNLDYTTGSEVMEALQKDGVDMNRFYAAVYEMEMSGGGWLPIQQHNSHDCMEQDNKEGSEEDGEVDMTLPLPPPLLPIDDESDNTSSSSSSQQQQPTRRRIDIKLFRKITTPTQFQDTSAAISDSTSKPLGKLPNTHGYFGIGVINSKTSANIGTLWRSAYQLNASYLFTIGSRYKHSSTDTLNTPSRIPLFELDGWSDFVNHGAACPSGAIWVAVEMGGSVPLEEFEHPVNAVYVLGSEDGGVPKSVLRSCHFTVSLDSERYASYNVAVAGSIIMYDRMNKIKKKMKMMEE